MTLEIALVLSIAVAALLCFVTGFMRVDMVALLVMVSVAIVGSATGLIPPVDVIAGFADPAVITVAGMFVISLALARTGVASSIGKRIYRLSGGSTPRLIAVMMLSTAVLAAFMNSAGLIAMMLPVVMDLSRRVRLAPSRLLLPLLLGALLGGTTSLLGTVANIVASDALRARDLEPFQIFDFTRVGVLILLAGVAFVSLVGWKLLPERDPRRTGGGEREQDLARSFELQERLFTVRIPAQSQLSGRSLAASRLGSAVGLHVVAILRQDGQTLAPGPAAILRSNDRLLVEGRPDLLRELQANRHLRPQEDGDLAVRLVSENVEIAEATIAGGSSLVGSTLAELDLRRRLGIMVLAIMREGAPRTAALQDAALTAGDSLLIQGPRDQIEALAAGEDFEQVRPAPPREALARYQLASRLASLKVTEGSMLIGRTLAQMRLGDAAGLIVLGLIRDGTTMLLPPTTEEFRRGDVLLVLANPDDMQVLRALQKLEIDESPIPDLSQLESERVALLEVVLAPRTTLVGRTLRQLHFREKYGLSVLAIWREGRSMRSNLRDIPLKFGDSLLLFGPRAKLRLLAAEPDFIGLTQAVQVEPRSKLAPVAIASLAAAVIPAVLGIMPIYVSVLIGATLAVLARCITLEEAYRGIDLSAIVLIAAMLPLSAAMDRSGAAQLLANGMLGAAGQLGPRGVLAALCVMTALGSQAIPSSGVVLLMAPIAITAAIDANIDPRMVMMGVALSASSFSSPVGRPGNAIVMGPGGYRYGDFLRIGLPLTVMLLLIVVFVLPEIFPWAGR